MIALMLALAAQAVTLSPGKGVILMAQDDGTVVPAAPMTSGLTAFDIAAARRLSAEGCTPQNCGSKAQPVTDDVEAARVKAALKTLRVVFGHVGGQSMLSMDNGFNALITYRARITVRGKTTTTDVCQVLPNKAGIEHWPYQIERIELSDFRLTAWDGGSPRCE